MKKIIEQQTFKDTGDFQAYYAAQRWVKEKGYDYGSSSVFNPVAVMKGNYYDYNLPFKMKNFTKSQRGQVHGIITGDLRNGPVHVHIYE